MENLQQKKTITRVAENLKWRNVMVENKGWKTVAISEHVELFISMNEWGRRKEEYKVELGIAAAVQRKLSSPSGYLVLG